MNKAKINFLHVCEYANVSAEGKVSVVDIYNNINAKELPVFRPVLYIAVNLTANLGEHKISMHVIDPDGKKVGPQMDWQAVATEKRPNFGQVARVEGLVLEKFGEYAIEISLDNELLKTHLFELIKV